MQHNTMNQSKKIVHLTSVHRRIDIRIFVKMCSSLAAAGYDITLVVADGEGDEVKNGVNIIDVGKTEGGRVKRILSTARRVYKKGLQLDADLYHLHDPELMPAGMRLVKRGKLVIFDAHEDFPKQITQKPYLKNRLLKNFLSVVFEKLEKHYFSRFSAVVGATPSIADKCREYNDRAINVNNYPKLQELVSTGGAAEKHDEIAYVGVITQIRGVKMLVKSLKHAPGIRLNLGGTFSEPEVEAEVKQYPEWAQVNELGYIDRKKVAEVLARSKVGMHTVLPKPNHMESFPTKLFEYMSAGIPVVVSDFPLWKEMVEKSGFGYCVDPLKPEAIGDAVMRLINNPELSAQMGQRGRLAVEEKYNWEIEEQKLLALYKELLT